MSGFHFFKVIAEQEVEYILLARSTNDEAYMVGRLAVCQIRNLVASNREQSDKNNFMQNILLGNMLVVDMYNKAKKLHIEQAKRLVYVIEVDGRKDSVIVEMVKNLFADRNRDFVTELDEQNIILIKDAADLKTEEDALNLAKTIVDNLHAEAMVRVRVGYGNTVNALQDIAKSYQEAKMALEVGRIFNVEEETISYGKLGIGRLIYQLPLGFLSFFFRKIHTIVQINIPWYKSSLVQFTGPFLALLPLSISMIVCAMGFCSLSTLHFPLIALAQYPIRLVYLLCTLNMRFPYFIQ